MSKTKKKYDPEWLDITIDKCNEALTFIQEVKDSIGEDMDVEEVDVLLRNMNWLEELTKNHRSNIKHIRRQFKELNDE